MRAALLSALLLLSTLAPIVSGQHHGTLDEEDSTVVIPDAMGDVQLLLAPRGGVPSQNGSQLGGNFDHIDIVKVTFGEETEKDFRIILQLKSLTNTNPSGFPFWTVSYSYGKINWQIRWGGCSGQSGRDFALGCLSYADVGRWGQGRAVQQFKIERRDSEQSIVLPIQKIWLFNENRVPAKFGTELVNLSARAIQFYASVFFAPGGDPTGGVTASDMAPNAGVFEKPFRLLRGVNSHGHLALDSDAPIRVSNGEATTIVYKVEALNHHIEPLTVQLEVRGIPPAWAARVPALLRLEPQSTTILPVIVSIPFTHDHGKTFTFRVHGQTVEDTGSFADVDLGVYWTEIPQPSAHHETADGGTFLHSGTVPNDRVVDQLEQTLPTYATWMNGIETDPDPAAKDMNVPANFNEYLVCVFRPVIQPGSLPDCGLPPENSASWFFPLSPQLLMGLDFDPQREGMLTFSILPKVTSPTSKVIVKLLLCDPSVGNTRTCATNATTAGGLPCAQSYTQVMAQGESGGALAANTPAHFEVPLKVDPKYDFLVYKPGINIGVCVNLRSDTPQNALFTEPRPEFVVKGSRLRLPLIEYHDPIDQAFENVGSIVLDSLSPFEKLVNPGRSTVFQFDLATESAEPQDVRLEVQGVNVAWAHLVGDLERTLVKGERQNVTLVVSPPDDAVDEERAELFMVVQNMNDPAVVAVKRLRATVVTNQDIPDESSLAMGADAKGDSPGPGLLGAIVAVGFVVVLVRRRR